MKCPICGCREIELSGMVGFSRHPIKECVDCKLVWFNDGLENHIVFRGK